MRTNYAGHDNAYRILKENGSVGWDKTTDAYAQREAGLTEVLRRGLAPTSGRLLELGCGAGNIAIWFARQGFEVSGVDISPTAINWARENAHAVGVNAQFVCTDILNLNDILPSESYDFVLDGHCFHCIIGPDRGRFLQQAHQLLKPNGFLFVDTMCGPVQQGAFSGYEPVSKCSVFQGIATRYWGDPEEIQMEIVDAGFTILDVSFELEQSHRSMIIQARKEPNNRIHRSRASRAGDA